MAVNNEAGRRSEAPFSRREEGRELGEEKEKEKEKEKKRKEVELNTYRKAFEEDFGNMEVLIKEEEVCDFPGGDTA